MNVRLCVVGLGILAVTGFVGCGGDDENDAGKGAAACQTSADCPAEHVCLVAYGQTACQPICTGSADACGASASCGSVGVLSVDVCQPPASEGSETPDAEEQPRIPCATDAECQAAQPGAICATYEGQRDCTMPCSVESDCDLPALGGMAIDFLTCIQDQGSSSRLACLPDARCFNNPLVCVTMPNGF
jgi:hypothetical protein